jgi:Spy/CpxP family protein refolding chaperone
MKVIFRSLVIASLFFSIFSQPGARAGEEGMSKEKTQKMEQRREEFHKEWLERLSKKLELTPEQTEKVSQVMKEGWGKISQEMKKMREQVLAIRKKTDSQIEKLLTPEQLEKFKELKGKLKERSCFKRHWMRRRGLHKKWLLERLSRKLELSTEQKEKVSQVMKEGWGKTSQEMKKMREQIRAIRKETDSRIEKLLTPAQLEKFKAFKERLRERRHCMRRGERGCFKRHWMRGGEGRQFAPEPESPPPEHTE